MGQSVIAGKSKEVILPLHSFLLEFTNLFILTVTFLYDDVPKVAAGGVKAFPNKRSSKYVLVNCEFCSFEVSSSCFPLHCLLSSIV